MGRVRFLVAAMTVATLSSTHAHSAQATRPAREPIDRQYQADLEKLAAICDDQKMPDQAARTRSWWISRFPDRQYLFLHTGRRPNKPAAGAPDLVRNWYDAFERRRKVHARHLFALAEAQLKAGRPEDCVQLLHEVLHEDPEHEMSLRILGYSSEGVRARIVARRARERHPQLGWQARGYWTIQSPHFRVTTNTSARDGIELAHRLEELYQVWQQLFFRFWSDSATLKQRFAGEVNTRAANRRTHEVVYFRDRSQYVAYFDRVEPRVRITSGYYAKAGRTSYFFAGRDSRQSSWYHEATHQLFQELPSTVDSVGEKANFWILEGIAMYMESLVRHDGYVTVGGFDSERLQYARYRKYREQFYLPLEELVALDRERLQHDDRIRKIYTQSAGLSHFLMDYDNGRYRDAARRYLLAIYQGRDEPKTLLSLLPKIDQQYHRFLDVTNQHLVWTRPPATLTKLCLCMTRVDDQGLRLLVDHSELRWLDLSFTRVTDDGFRSFDKAGKIDQLVLERTALTNRSLEQIGKLKELEELDLSHTGITGKGLSHLRNLRRLKILWLTGTDIDDAALQHLQSLRSLEQLDVEGTRVTPQALKALKAKLPKLN